jgi:death-on-curing protein
LIYGFHVRQVFVFAEFSELCIDRRAGAADVAASYLFGLARNYAFSDGNKRTAWAVAETFILPHGFELDAGDEEIFAFVLDVATGATDEAASAEWFRKRLIIVG